MTVVGVIGYGTVGKAVAEGFKGKGFDVLINDIDEGAMDLSDCTTPKEALAKNCDVIFICVGTPSWEDGRCDLRQVYSAYYKLTREIFRAKTSPIVAIKSTVTPGTTRTLAEGYKPTVSNPEFMRANHALDDFLDPDRIIVGGEEPWASKLMSVYDKWHCLKRIVSSDEAEMCKYLSNAFLVSKVAFACEAEEACKRLRIDANTVMDLVSMDRRISHSHLKPELGTIDADSPCLPKDLRALIRLLENDWRYDTGYLRMVYGKAIK